MGTIAEKLKEVAARYAAGKSTPEELKRIDAWYKRYENHNDILPDAQKVKSSAETALQAALLTISLNTKRNRQQTLWRPVLKMAAVLLLVGTAGIISYKMMSRETQPVWHQISTTAGNRKQITLPDGSRISMNSASTVRYAVPFKGQRKITLIGEAFFNVVHDSKHPFIVHTRQLSIQVLGTSYNVQAFANEQYTSVAVATGKVGVMNRNKPGSKAMMLLPGEELTFKNNQFEKKNIAIASIDAWQQGVLEFKGETLEQIAKVLARTYNVKFTINDPKLLTKRFQLKAKKEPLANILKLLSITGGNFPYTIKGKQVTIG